MPAGNGIGNDSYRPASLSDIPKAGHLGRKMHFSLIILLLAIIAGLGYMSRLFYRRARSAQKNLRIARRQYKEVTDFLGLFTASLSTVADFDRAMEMVAHYLCELLETESLCIFRVGEDRSLQAAGVAGMFPPLQRSTNMVMAKGSYLREHLRREKIAFGEGIIGQVAELQQSLLIEDALLLPESERLPRDTRTLMAVPMLLENRLLGVVCAVNGKQQDRLFTTADLIKLENLTYQAAVASNLIGIYAERSRQERLSQELDLARQIHQSLLPVSIPVVGDYQIEAFSHSALEVGGDYYDFIPMGHNRLMLVIADASGKGMPACMLMAMCQSFCRSAAERFTMLEVFLKDLNRHLFRDSDRGHFVTMAILVLDYANHVCEYARAGHTELLLRYEDGKTRTIKPRGPALGLLPEEAGPIRFDTLSFAFPPGSAVMLFTDGITEALDEDGQEFGLERLEQIWRNNLLPPEQLKTIVLADMKQFIRDEPQSDDQTILIVARPGPARPSTGVPAAVGISEPSTLNPEP